MRHRILSLLLLCTLLWSTAGTAHPLRPAVVTLTPGDDAVLGVSIQANFEAWIAGISAGHDDTRDAPQAEQYDQLRQLPAEALASRIEEFLPRLLAGVEIDAGGTPVSLKLVRVDVPPVGDTGYARLSTLILAGALPPDATWLTWRLAGIWGNNVLRVKKPGVDDPTHSEWLKDGAASTALPLDRTVQPVSRWATAVTYLWLGLTHIVPLGADHILFVLGIFLLSQHWSPLLWQVTAFTLAHSITLGLSMYGVMSLSPSVVESLIALSIVYIGIENLVARTLKPWRIAVVFCFGLLHGLGFAGVLTEIGLPRSEFATALITFNVGVELGQLTVIGGAWIVLAAWQHQRPWYRSRVILPVSALIACVGLFWTVQRMFF